MKTLERVLKIVALIVLVIYFTACKGEDGGAPAAAVREPVAADPIASPVSPVVPALPVAPTPTPAPQNVALTYYKITRTAHPTISGQPVGPIPMTGACVVYLTETYCWDDGAQGYADFVVGGIHYAIYESYWNVSIDPNGLFNCGINCQADPFSQPTKLSLFGGSIDPTAMFAIGTAVNVNCTDSGGQLNCADFVIDLNRAAL